MTRTINKARLFLKLAEVQAMLGQTVTNDAIAAGWLQAVTVKRGIKRPRAMILFSARDVAEVSKRLNSGEYPGQDQEKLK